jgi:hypothetical protein
MNFCSLLIRGSKNLQSVASRLSSGQAGVAAKQTQKPQSQFQKAKQFMYTNRQGFLNIFGTYMVFSMAIHQFKNKKLWDEREEEMRETVEELAHVHALLDNGEWCARTDSAIRAGGLDSGVRALLLQELRKPEDLSPIERYKAKKLALDGGSDGKKEGVDVKIKVV